MSPAWELRKVGRRWWAFNPTAVLHRYVRPLSTRKAEATKKLKELRDGTSR